MSNLFIIGNGFDVAHGLPTKYSDFKLFLYNFSAAWLSDDKQDNNPIGKGVDGIPQLYCHMGRGAIDWGNMFRKAWYLYELVDHIAKSKCDIEWNQFESLLGCIDYLGLFDKKLDDNQWNRLSETLLFMASWFNYWLEFIDISEDDVSNKRLSYVDRYLSTDEALVFSFNYTETMEKYYGVPSNKVYYVHGKRE